MRKSEIICDGCDADLTYTGNSVDYRLVLTTEGKTPWFVREGLTIGAMTDVNLEPPIKRTHHFCGIPCLIKWLGKAHRPLLEKYIMSGT